MVSKLYLMSGHVSNGDLEVIDRKILDEAKRKRVLVLNLASPDEKKLRSRMESFQRYFTQLGTPEVDFISKGMSPVDITRSFKEAGWIYLTGGDTVTLMNNIRVMNLSQLISSFDGIVAGNSAGAYVLTPEYLKLRDGGIEIFPTMGIVPFWLKAHYELQFDAQLKELSKGRVIYALQNGSAVVKGKELEIIGNVWKFSEGRKDKV